MPVKWKKKFNPDSVLDRIILARNVNQDGRYSFSAFDLESCLPVLHSMLEFPTGSKDLDTINLVWMGLNKVSGELTKSSFIEAINLELSERLTKKEEVYFFLTSISIHSEDAPRKLKIEDVELKFLAGDYPSKFKSRYELFRDRGSTETNEPLGYCRLVVKVKAKTFNSAVSKALRAIDLQRALWCLMSNPRIQLAFGNSAFSPINVIRLGNKHSLHLTSGKVATDTFWFEPGFKEAKIFRLNKPDTVHSNCQWALRKIRLSRFGDELSSALLKYVRALDESDPNTAFVRLWGALESLTTSGGKYDFVVSRCSVLFKDSDYHRQVLEHLREYRNSNIHSGEESQNSRIHCYQLQLYFVQLIWFNIRNSGFFESLDEVKKFLDLPMDMEKLQRQIQLIRKAQKFIL